MKLNNKIAPHETFDVHELLVAKSVAATKCATMSALVKDEELKSIFQQELANGQDQIKELQDLLQQSVFISPDLNTSQTNKVIPEY